MNISMIRRVDIPGVRSLDDNCDLILLTKRDGSYELMQYLISRRVGEESGN